MDHDVIIIDDEPHIRNVVRALGDWENLGLRVVAEASDGMTALELIKQIRPEIIISDVKMPKLDGLCLVKEINKLDYNPCVIMISGYDDFHLVRDALRLGVADYLLKPIKREELNKRLQLSAENLKNQAHKVKGLKVPNQFSDKWFSSFQDHLSEIRIMLYGGNINRIKQAFEDLKSAIPDTHVSVTIYCYYALLNVLHDFLDSQNILNFQKVFEDNYFVFESGNNLQRMFDYMSDLFCKGIQYADQASVQNNKLNLYSVKEYIDAHYDENLTLQKLADVFYVSKEYISRSFKDEFAVNFSDYLLSIRMEKAKELILNFNLPIKEVWPIVGYTDPSYFYRCFKKYYGITPGEMQEINK